LFLPCPGAIYRERSMLDDIKSKLARIAEDIENLRGYL
jgi:hypothetical protein